MQAVIACLALFGVGAALLWALLAFVGGRTARAMHEAARELGLAPDSPAPDGREATGDEVWAGTVDGVAVRVGSGLRVTTTVQPTIVAVIGVGATLPRPLPFALEIGRAGTPVDRTLRTGDKAFDRICAVATRDETAARSVLAGAAARDAIRDLVRRGGSTSVVTGVEVYLGVFGAHLHGAASIVAAVRSAVRVASVLSGQ